MSPLARRVRLCGGLAATLLAAGLVASCGPVTPAEPEWPKGALQWYERARASFRSLDGVDAEQAVKKALELHPSHPDVKLLAARIALARLDYDGAIQRLEGLDSSDARAIRGRAFWYSGQIEQAAEELELLLADPEVRDQWATGVVKLARMGRGRKPFEKSGPLVAVLEMPRVPGNSMVVPVELNGQPVLGLVSTGSTEVIVDSGSNREPSWVNLRFQQRIEVRDVPALTQDLSGISRQLQAPIKVMLGSNLLRHLNVTFDYRGRQFVVRNYEPPAPPDATALDVQYIRGGGMVLRGMVGLEPEPQQFAFFVDSGSNYPLVLDESAWGRTKVPSSELTPIQGNKGVSQARIPQLRLGALDVVDVEAVSGVPFDELEKVLDIELDGLLGAGILGDFRVTLADQGRTMWLEGMPAALPEGPPPAPIPDLELPPAVPPPAQPGAPG